MRLSRKFVMPLLVAGLFSSQSFAVDVEKDAFNHLEVSQDRILIASDADSLMEAYTEVYGQDKSMESVRDFLVCMVGQLDLKDEIYRTCGISLVALVKACKVGGPALCIGATANTIRECQEPSINVLQAISECKAEESEAPQDEGTVSEKGELEDELLLDESNAVTETITFP